MNESSKSSEPLVSNESHNPILEASLEKALDAEEASINSQPNYLTPTGSKLFDREYKILYITLLDFFDTSSRLRFFLCNKVILLCKQVIELTLFEYLGEIVSMKMISVERLAKILYALFDDVYL